MQPRSPEHKKPPVSKDRHLVNSANLPIIRETRQLQKIIPVSSRKEKRPR